MKSETRDARKSKKNKQLTNDDLEANVNINIGETDTQTLLYM